MAVLSRIRNLRVRFSLRLLLVAMTVVAVFLGMWVESARRQRAGVDWVRRERGHVDYDFGMLLENGSFLDNAKPPGPRWLHEALGVDYFASVECIVLDCEEITDLAPLENFPQLEALGIMNSVHPGTDLSPIQSLPRLRILALNYTGLESEQLDPICSALPNLRIESVTDPHLNRTPTQR